MGRECGHDGPNPLCEKELRPSCCVPYTLSRRCGMRSCRSSAWACRAGWPRSTGCSMIPGSSSRSGRSSTRRRGRPSIPMETYLRMMFLRFRYKLGLRGVVPGGGGLVGVASVLLGSPLGEAVPHPSTLEKITTRCGERAIDGAQRGAAGQGGTRTRCSSSTRCGRTRPFCRPTSPTRPIAACWPGGWRRWRRRGAAEGPGSGDADDDAGPDPFGAPPCP